MHLYVYVHTHTHTCTTHMRVPTHTHTHNICKHPVVSYRHMHRLTHTHTHHTRILQTLDASVGECPNVPGRMECVPVGCNASIINDTFGATGWASFDSGVGVVSNMAPVGANATVTCNTGYYLRVEGDAGGATTCSDTCLLSLTTCLPIECVGGAVVPVADSVVVDSPAKFMFPNRYVVAHAGNMSCVQRYCSCDQFVF